MNRILSNKNMMMFLMIVMMIISVFLISACAKPTEEALAPENSDNQPPVLNKEIEGEVNEEAEAEAEAEAEMPQDHIFPYYAPLTGMGSDVEITERPIMVMIENSPQARPQTGLDQADIIYEILAEGEITRFAAIYQSHSPEVIGPVRSIRPYYVEIGEAYDALIVHAGWSQEAINMINSKKLAHFDEVYGDGAYFWRSKDRGMPHNLYTSIELIRNGAVKKKFREQWNGSTYTFTDKKDQIAGTSAAKVTIPYIRGYTVAYEYDAKSGHYLRYMAGEPHVDPVSTQQLAAANVLVVISKHRVLDSEGRRSVDMNGPGKGYILQQGKMQEVTWKKSNGIIRAYVDDKEVPLIPGQTWVQFVPEGTTLAVE